MRRAVASFAAAAALFGFAAVAEARPVKRCGTAWAKPSKYRPLMARRCAKAVARAVRTPGPAKTGTAPAAGSPTRPATQGAAPAIAETISTPAAVTTTTPTCDPSPWLGAIAEDVGGFRLRLTRTCVPAGRVLVNFRNRDLQPHNLYAVGVSPVVPAKRVLGDVDGERTTDGEIALTAGEWRIYCSIDGHEAMTKRLDVIAP